MWGGLCSPLCLSSFATPSPPLVISRIVSPPPLALALPPFALACARAHCSARACVLARACVRACMRVCDFPAPTLKRQAFTPTGTRPSTPAPPPPCVPPPAPPCLRGHTAAVGPDAPRLADAPAPPRLIRRCERPRVRACPPSMAAPLCPLERRAAIAGWGRGRGRASGAGPDRRHPRYGQGVP